MKCLRCGTDIKAGESFYWQYDKPEDEESEGGIHDDCLIRECEFAGDTTKADDIFSESDAFYTLPKE